ncbi:hypothetical protein R3I94_009208 [Phoxinus phoxinus]|uniref:Uncharacterized protein n=1 Tax=Phoxinus phoxinus TaxID=58324 RepID=A0AAN9CCC5_9TELE
MARMENMSDVSLRGYKWTLVALLSDSSTIKLTRPNGCRRMRQTTL